MEKEVRARKTHYCSNCLRRIYRGDLYTFGKGVETQYDNNNNRIGVKYLEWKFCNRSDCLIYDGITRANGDEA